MQPTKFVLKTCLKLFVRYQLLRMTDNGLDMVEDQFIEIRILFAAFHEEPVTKTPARDINVWLSYVCE